jgi:hypothetical protein
MSSPSVPCGVRSPGTYVTVDRPGMRFPPRSFEHARVYGSIAGRGGPCGSSPFTQGPPRSSVYHRVSVARHLGT